MLSFIHFNMSNARIGYIFTLVLSLCVIRYELFILFLYCKVCLPCVVCIVLFIGPLHSANDSWLSMRSTNNLYQMWPLFDGSAICNIHTVMCIHLCAHLCNVCCCNKVNISCRVTLASSQMIVPALMEGISHCTSCRLLDKYCCTGNMQDAHLQVGHCCGRVPCSGGPVCNWHWWLLRI